MMSKIVNKSETWFILDQEDFPLQKFGPFFLTAGLALVVSLGCNRDQVQSTRVEKIPPPASPTPLPPGHPPMGTPPAAMPANGVPPPPRPQGGQALTWTLPAGWTTAQAGGMRYATLKPPAAVNAEVSVVMLSGPAGGELANVNRWRSQLGLSAVEEAALASARKSVKCKAGQVAVFEFANAGNRMVVGLLATADGNTWFLKLMGGDAPVSEAKPDFLKLLGTLSLG
jgi:hypothetical protein